MLSHGLNGDHDGIGGPFHDGGKGVIHRSVVTDGSTEGDGPIDLFYRREGGFELNVLNFFRFWWG